MCASNCSGSSSRMRYERLAGAPPSSLRWWTKRTGERRFSGMSREPKILASACEGQLVAEPAHGREQRVVRDRPLPDARRVPPDLLELGLRRRPGLGAGGSDRAAVVVERKRRQAKR